ncbi:putative F-box domain-containing protein [Lupinus albus]|uniref:Putative F-box domain-containing protein n=1 Tax=Lupinus albus TaxID=3870 RepID=A0A6A4QJQ9_LUPAL|nr:putative F-box domain-containing protein [Lupinus albus]
MVQLHQHQLHEKMQRTREEEKTEAVQKRKRNDTSFINDNIDILTEILKRLDGPSLGVSSCVCRLWCNLTHNNDSLWEHLCFRHLSTPPPPSVRAMVAALGGYKRLYMVCVRPVLSRLGESEESKEASLDSA